MALNYTLRIHDVRWGNGFSRNLKKNQFKVPILFDETYYNDNVCTIFYLII